MLRQSLPDDDDGFKACGIEELLEVGGAFLLLQRLHRAPSPAVTAVGGKSSSGVGVCCGGAVVSTATDGGAAFAGASFAATAFV